MIDLGDLGGVLGAVAGAGSVFMAWKTVRLSAIISRDQLAHSATLAEAEAERNRALSRESIASTIYDEYLRCCIAYPHLASFNVFTKESGLLTASEIWSAETKESEQYLWFVSYLLHACEGILDYASDKEDWLQAIRDQLEYHLDILDFAWEAQWKDYYSRKLNEQVQKVLSKHSGHLKHA